MDQTQNRYSQFENIKSSSFVSDNLADYNALIKRAREHDCYSYLQLSSWHISNARNVKDYVKAYNYASKAIGYGYYEGYYILGQLLILGTGCEKNVVRGLNYLKKFLSKAESRNYDESSVADAYYRMVQGYYSLGHYEKALQYYHKLRHIDIELADELGDIENTISNTTNERNTSLIKYGVISFAIIISAVYMVTNFKEDFLKFVTSPTQKSISVVTNVDISTVTKNDDTPTKKINTQNDFYLLSEEAFKEKKLEQRYPIDISSSSEYISSIGTDYSAGCVLDNDITTSWQEGATGSGIGESIKVRFDDVITLKGLCIVNGKAKDTAGFKDNNRVQTFILRGYEEFEIKIEDKMDKQYILLSKPLEAASLEIVIDSVYRGNVFDDTCITELEFYQ